MAGERAGGWQHRAAYLYTATPGGGSAPLAELRFERHEIVDADTARDGRAILRQRKGAEFRKAEHAVTEAPLVVADHRRRGPAQGIVHQANEVVLDAPIDLVEMETGEVEAVVVDLQGADEAIAHAHRRADIFGDD